MYKCTAELTRIGDDVQTIICIKFVHDSNGRFKKL